MEHAQYNFKSQEVLDFRGTLEKYMWFFAVVFCSGFLQWFCRFFILLSVLFTGESCCRPEVCVESTRNCDG